MSNVMDFNTCVANENACLWNMFAKEFGFINLMIFHMLLMDPFGLNIAK